MGGTDAVELIDRGRVAAHDAARIGKDAELAVLAGDVAGHDVVKARVDAGAPIPAGGGATHQTAVTGLDAYKAIALRANLLHPAVGAHHNAVLAHAKHLPVANDNAFSPRGIHSNAGARGAATADRAARTHRLATNGETVEVQRHGIGGDENGRGVGIRDTEVAGQLITTAPTLRVTGKPAASPGVTLPAAAAV